MCEPISYTDLNSDGVIISPVFDEISKDVFDKIQKNSNFILLDPQGFLRQINSENKIYLKQTDLNFSNISAIKTSPDELNCLTGNRETDGMKILQKKGIENVILTDQQNISLLAKDKIYSVKLPNIRLFDTTGLGDIFCSVFCCTMLKEKDFLWAFSFAAGAVQAALESKQIGLEKIPIKAAIESNGSYFYHTVKFRDV
jgi:sugar/nucleoside kinase (ribokinase family)